MLAQTPERVGARVGERHYSLYGLSLALSARPDLLSVMDARLKSFSAERELWQDLRFDFNADAAISDGRPDRGLRTVYEPDRGEVLYDDAADRLYLAFERISAVCDPVQGHTRVSVYGEDPADRWLLSHPVLTLPLLETLKRRGLYSMHAAGLSRAGRALLVAGTSGAGKTTLTIALARAGFDYLSDDMVFLSTRTGAVQVHAFPDEVDITDTTAQFFPELRPLLAKCRQPGWPKWSFRMESVYGANVAWTCAPAAVVFPRIAHTASSRLEPMRSDEALLELLPNVLLTESRACRAHVAALAQLTHTTPCYRLWTGDDFDALPTLLGSLCA